MELGYSLNMYAYVHVNLKVVQRMDPDVSEIWISCESDILGAHTYSYLID